jgi:transcriptional regulator with XRE-family HTH domain
MTLETKTRKRLAKYEHDPEYQAEKLSLAVTEELARVMREKGITKKELAERLGVSKARVSNILNGSPNLTLRTLATLSTALESEVRFEIRSSRPRAASLHRARKTA